MAEATVRHRKDEWIEVVLRTPTNAGELGKAYKIMLTEIGYENTANSDDVFEVLSNEEEVILRARQPSNRHAVTWADGAINSALSTLLDYRDGNIRAIAPESQALAVAIDTLRAIGGDPNG